MDEKGLTSKEVERLIEKGKVNYIDDKSSQTKREIIRKNIFTYFNAIYVLKKY